MDLGPDHLQVFSKSEQLDGVFSEREFIKPGNPKVGITNDFKNIIK